MSPDVDHDLRRLFAESADTIVGLPPGFDTEVLDAGAKCRRNRRTMLGAAAGALALVAIAAVWQGPHLVNRSTPPTSNHDSQGTQTVDAWVASLPRGRDVQAAYADGQTLHAGDTRVTITGEDITRSSSIELLAATDMGWLARVSSTVGDKPADSTYTTGVIAPDGVFTPLADQPKASLITAVSPDGTMFAAGRQVHSAATGAVLQTIPDGLSATMWIDSGIVLYRMGDSAGEDSGWLWDPSDPTVPPSELALPEDSDPEQSDGALTPGGLAAVNHAGCTELYDYGLMPQEPDVRFCEGPTFALSDSGSVALVRPWTAYDISSGDKSALPVPTLIGEFEDFDPRTYSTFFWEDDNNVVFNLEVGGNAATVYIRCVISTQHCERATDKLADFRTPLGLSRID